MRNRAARASSRSTRRARSSIPPRASSRRSLVLDVGADMAVMREEIFGPLLPVVPLRRARRRHRLCQRARSSARRSTGSATTRAAAIACCATRSPGGVTVNGCLTHFAQEAQPFGGVGASGTGSYHGVYGFRTFSKEKAVYYQGRLGIMPLLLPPYGTCARPRAGVVHEDLT